MIAVVMSIAWLLTAPGLPTTYKRGNVRCGSLADLRAWLMDGRFTPKSGHAQRRAWMSAKRHKRACTFGVIVEPTLLADFRAKSPRVPSGVTPK